MDFSAKALPTPACPFGAIGVLVCLLTNQAPNGEHQRPIFRKPQTRERLRLAGHVRFRDMPTVTDEPVQIEVPVAFVWF
jgi:hypothetical protein